MTRILRRYSVFFGLAAALLCGWGFQSLEAAETQQLRIITTNDLHSYLKPLYYRYLDEMKPWGPQSREGDYVNKAELFYTHSTMF